MTDNGYLLEVLVSINIVIGLWVVAQVSSVELFSKAKTHALENKGHVIPLVPADLPTHVQFGWFVQAEATYRSEVAPETITRRCVDQTGYYKAWYLLVDNHKLPTVLADAIVSWVLYHAMHISSRSDPHYLLTSYSDAQKIFVDYRVVHSTWTDKQGLGNFDVSASGYSSYELHEAFSRWLSLASKDNLVFSPRKPCRTLPFTEVEETLLRRTLHAYVSKGELPLPNDPCSVISELYEWLNCPNVPIVTPPQQNHLDSVACVMQRIAAEYSWDGNNDKSVADIAREMLERTSGFTYKEMVLYVCVVLATPTVELLRDFSESEKVKACSIWASVKARANPPQPDGKDN
jgi:hypothetical protein